MAHLVVLMIAVFCCLGRVVTSLGGFLVSVQSKLAGLDDPTSTSWKHGCAGTVVSVHSALTCASCTVYPDDRLGLQIVSADNLRLYGGNASPDHADTDPSGQIVYVNAVLVHPEYLANEMENVPNEYDFVLLATKKPFAVGDSLKVLPLYSTDVNEVRNVLATNGTKCFTMTWYFYMNGKPVNEKPEWGEMPVAFEKIEACKNLSNAILKSVDEEYSCAKGLGELPICRVDTGSPVVCDGKLLAVVINDRLNCDKAEEHVVISGINNALAFLVNPDLYIMSDSKSTKVALTTVVERGHWDRQSSQGLALPEMAAMIPAISIMLLACQ